MAHQIESRNFDAISAALLGVVKRVVRLPEQFGKFERRRIVYNHADADARSHRAAVHFARGLGKRTSYPFGERNRLVHAGIVKYGRKLLSSEPAEQIA